MAVTITLSELVNRTVRDVLDPGGQGFRVVLAQAISTTSQTTFTLTDADRVNISDVIEFGDELVLVTAKSDDATPVITVARAYFTTTASTYSSGDVGHVNPTYPRIKIAEAIRRSFARMEALGVPLIKSVTANREEDYSYLEMPTDTREVLEVLYWGTDGRFLPLGGWQFFDHVPLAKSSTGKALNVGNYVEDEDDLEIIYRAPYRWSTHPSAPVAASTIDIPEGAEDLPCLYAAAWLASGREMSRTEIDRSEEWNQGAATSQGASASVVRAKWQEFYRALDEARRLEQRPQPIIYKRRPRF